MYLLQIFLEYNLSSMKLNQSNQSKSGKKKSLFHFKNEETKVQRS